MDREIARGKFLIAMPILSDPNFRQTVVLLCEHGPDGSLGLRVGTKRKDSLLSRLCQLGTGPA